MSRIPVFGENVLRGILSTILALAVASSLTAQVRFAVSFPEKLSAGLLDGRLLLMLSTDVSGEPRFQIKDSRDTQLIFGVDVAGMKPGEKIAFNHEAFGYPIASLEDVPAGEYHVQALLHIYETFQRADGHVVKLPMDRGEGQHWNRAPGNLYSTPKKVRFGPNQRAAIEIELDSKIPPIPDPPETKYIKHIKIQS